MSTLAAIKTPIGQYTLVTLSYWAFTLTDGALRMLVVLYFHQLGYGALAVAMLFVLYELFGMITNLVGGWLGARLGLNVTMHIGLGLQIMALAMLLVDPSILSIAYVMIAQALSGIAKDLNKMSAKSSIKQLIPNNTHESQNQLYRWVAILTGSKNALKGVGFFMGGLLLSLAGFRGAIGIMLVLLIIVFVGSVFLLENALGKAAYKPKFTELLSNNKAINQLAAARFFLFASRDVWFVVALPVFLQSQWGWSYTTVGILMATWVIAYGGVQSSAPLMTQRCLGHAPDGKTALLIALALSVIPIAIIGFTQLGLNAQASLMGGLFIFGFVFAINSSVHSFLIVDYAREDGVSLDVGFYYMANAGGRLLGTLLSGGIYQLWGLYACLAISSAMIVITALLSISLPRRA